MTTTRRGIAEEPTALRCSECDELIVDCEFCDEPDCRHQPRGAGCLRRAEPVVMMNADLAARRGLPILGLFPGMQLAAVAPEEMSIAIAPAIRKLMKHHQLAMSDVDLWELHEAYAVTTLYNQAQLETPWEITNVNGGAVPLGHPYGMSGIRYLGSTLLELGRRGRNRAIVGVCTAGGMSTAAYLERP